MTVYEKHCAKNKKKKNDTERDSRTKISRTKIINVFRSDGTMKKPKW